MGYRTLKTHIYSVPLRKESVGAISPAVQIRRLYASARGNGEWLIAGGKSGLKALANLAVVAASHKKSIVHIPLSGVERPQWLDASYMAHDLVLVHHSLQMPPSAWKGMRAYFANPKPKTLQIPRPDKTFVVPLDTRLKEKDLVDLRTHSNTLFVVASEVLFRYMAGSFEALSTCSESGDHSHLFDLARHEGLRGSQQDLTMMYCALGDWVAG